MNPTTVRSSFPPSTFVWIALLAMLSLTSCKPEGFINKVKYRGETFLNTCETFTADINKVISANSNASKLAVSEYDNTDFNYFYLEPGQFEIKGDTLYFRLASDLEYAQYLDKGIAVHVNASYKAVSQLASLESDAAGDIGTLKVDREYYIANRKPFFVYKFPLAGKDLAGKQIMLSFAVAKYKASGDLKSFLCETEATPIGTAMPSCCTAARWEPVGLQSVVGAPKLDVKAESFRYAGFTGTIDVMFMENSAKLSDDSSFSTMLITSFVKKYADLGYKITRLDLTGWASPGGTVKLNENLSQARADALKQGLTALNGNIEGLEINAKGMGEDWDRVKLLTEISSLTREQKDQVYAIADDATLALDQKEAKLRKVAFWDTLVEEVLVKARHTFCVMDFKYEGSQATIDRFAERLPVASQALEQVASTVISAKPYTKGADIQAGLASLNDLLTKKASPNLYAMRADYYIAQGNISGAVADLERAAQFRDAQAGNYQAAAQGYKITFADSYSFEEKQALYNQLSQLTRERPNDREVFFQRAIIMDKLGLLDAALGEYDKLMDGSTPTAAQLNNRAVARLKGNMVTMAKADFLAAAAADPKLAEAEYNLAVVCAYQGLSRETETHLDKAIALDNKYKGMILNNPVFSVMSGLPRFDKYRE
ncbi:MAG: hypothetical protein NWR72_20990 [Bacteroidia bacterium]|nr:hypothetical protein [Bacteroidia bacterium]